MILVVVQHISFFTFCEDFSAPLDFLHLMRMPTFFFVSGFLAYNIKFEWTIPNTLKLTWKKIKVQIIPTFVFFCAFIILRQTDFWDTFITFLKQSTKGGYWFTWVLLQMFIIYYVICLAFKGRNLAIIVLWILSIGIYELVGKLDECSGFKYEYLLEYTSLIRTVRFLQFFLLGNLVHRYWDKAQRLFDCTWFFPIVVGLTFFCCADLFCWGFLKFSSGGTQFLRDFSASLLVIILVMSFRYYQSLFSKNTIVGKGLQYIGVRTLDIYLIHYILLPVMPSVGIWLNANQPNFIVEIVLSLSVGLIVIAFCLLISNILRISPFLRLYLFGRK